MIKVIIFDFFDVFRTDGYKRWLTRRGIAREGVYKTVNEQSDRGEIDDEEFFHAIADAIGEPYEVIKHEMEDKVELNEPLVAYAEELKTTHRLALLSNCSSAYLRRELAEYDLERLFDEVVISGEVGLIKPDLAIFEHIMDKLGVTPAECIFTDDNPNNVAAAEAIGIRSIIYTDVPSLRKEITALTGA